MSAPKIKLYRLKRDFTIDNLDQDRKSEVNDELLPVKDKYIVPSDIMQHRKMKGIIPSMDKFCEKLLRVSSIGEVQGTLSLEENSDESDSSSEELQFNNGVYNITPIDEGIAVNPILSDGFYPRVKIDDEVIPRSGYEYVDGQIIASLEYRNSVFTDVFFTNNAPPSVPNDIFSSLMAPVYSGKNSFFNPFLFTLKDGVVEKYKKIDGVNVLSNHVSDFDFLERTDDSDFSSGDWFIDTSTGKISLRNATIKDVFLSYVVESKLSRRYISEHVNWVPENEPDIAGGHLYMGPDVFVGMKRYEPNSYEDPQTGQVVNIGTIPCFVERGDYSLSHRNGSVSFSGDFSSDESNNVPENAGKSGSVHVSYANICGIDNVTEQVFEVEYTYDDIYGSNSESLSDSSSEDLPEPDGIVVIPGLRVGDIVFKASSADKRYLGSIGAMWVGRSDMFMPRNVYVTHDKERDGVVERVTELKPMTMTIDPYDKLEVKTI